MIVLIMKKYGNYFLIMLWAKMFKCIMCILPSKKGIKQLILKEFFNRKNIEFSETLSQNTNYPHLIFKNGVDVKLIKD